MALANVVKKPQLREMIIDFYTTYDSEQLRMGVDINGMVEWTMLHGVEKLNQLLMKQYGAKLEPKKNLGNAAQQFNRMSTAFVNQNVLQTEEAKRDEIYLKLYNFYERHEKSKLQGIQKIVDFAMFKGVEVLNQKLMVKYGEDLGNDWRFKGGSGGGPPPTPARVSPPKRQNPPKDINQGPPPPKPSHRVEKSIDLEPPPPSYDEIRHEVEIDLPGPPPLEDFIDENSIEDELIRFYGYHDPPKLDALEFIIPFATGLGRIEFNKKLLQFYGSTLDDPIPEEDEPEEEEPSFMAPTPVASKPPKPVMAPPAPAPKPSYAPPKPSMAPPKPSMAPPKPSMAPPKPSMAPPRPSAPAPAPVNSSAGAAGPCDNYQLDMSGATFGVCMCGYLKGEHGKSNGRPAPRNVAAPMPAQKPPKPMMSPPKPSMAPPKPMGKPPKPMMSPPKPSMAPPKPMGKPPKPSMAPPKPMGKPPKPSMPAHGGFSQPRIAHGGQTGQACDNYQLDLTGTVFGACVCGQSRAAHSGRKVGYGGGGAASSATNFGAKREFTQYQPPSLVPASIPVASNSYGSYNPPAVSGGRQAGSACNNYQLDMTGATFGVCVCGFSRSEHQRSPY